MKFADVAKGIKAEKVAAIFFGGKTIPTRLRPLSAAEEIGVIADAVKAAQKAGVREPKPGDPIYEAHLKARTLALACLDPDSPEEARTTTFASPDEVLEMDSDSVGILMEQQSMWQEECSPSINATSTKDLFKTAQEVSERGDPFDYARLSPVTRWRLQLFTAVLLCSSPGFKLWLSLLSEDTEFDVRQLIPKIREALEQAGKSATTVATERTEGTSP